MFWGIATIAIIVIGLGGLYLSLAVVAGSILKARALELEDLSLPPLCSSCHFYLSDPPSLLCPSCNAYSEHTGEF